MKTVWVLEEDNSSYLSAFANYLQGFAAYRDHIDERTSGMEWTDDNFEWHDDTTNGLRRLSCYCYGEFIASLQELEVQGGTEM